jgi:hypothetical protein
MWVEPVFNSQLYSRVGGVLHIGPDVCHADSVQCMLRVVGGVLHIDPDVGHADSVQCMLRVVGGVLHIDPDVIWFGAFLFFPLQNECRRLAWCGSCCKRMGCLDCIKARPLVRSVLPSCVHCLPHSA